MGWLWNESQGLGRLKPRVGWRPGALSRTLRDIIRATRAGALEDSRSRSAHSRSKLKTRSQTSVKKTQSKRLDDEEDEPPPTLHVLRRDGTYYVTMYPIKQETMDVPQLEVPMKPHLLRLIGTEGNPTLSMSMCRSSSRRFLMLPSNLKIPAVILKL